jgi:folate-binding protein YgfZ
MRNLFLHEIHEKDGARLGVRGDAEIVLGYGPLDAEWHALERTAVLVDRSHRALLAVAGPEARLYLHGMVTNEVKALRPGQGNHAAVITARGKMLGDGRVLARENDELLLDLDPEAHEATLAHLDQFLISEDCTLHDLTGRLAILGVYGPRAGDVVAAALGTPAPPLPLHHHVDRAWLDAPAMLLAAAPGGTPGYELWVPAPVAAAAWSALLAATRTVGGTAAGDDVLEAARVHRVVPRYAADMDETTIPLEANLDDAISYTKGCYVGQEVIAKATYRGQVRRKLAQLAVPAGTRPGAALVEGEKAVGTITSVLDPDPTGGPPLALGYVRRDRLTLGARLALEGGGEAEITWAPPAKED